MKFRLEQHFASTVQEVENAFVDPDLFAHLRDNPDLGKPDLLEKVDEGGVVHLRVRFAFTGELSPPLSAVVEPVRLTWVEESTLDRRTHNTKFHILADHYPDRLRCSGKVELSADENGGTVRLAQGELKVSVPLLGGRIERAVVEALEAQAVTQARVVQEWLVSRRQAEA